MNRTQVIDLLNRHGIPYNPASSDESLFDLVSRVLGDLQAGVERPGETLGSSPPLNLRALGGGGGGGILADYERAKPGQERADFRLKNFDAIRNGRIAFNPTNANTIDSGLAVDTLSDALVTVAVNKLALLSSISIAISNEPLAPKRPVLLKKASATSAAQINPTSFETGDTTLDGVKVTPAQISKSFHVTNDQQQFGYRLDDLAQINADTFTNAISDVVTGLMTTGNFGAGVVVGAASAFDADDLPGVWRVGKNFRRKNLILDGGHLASLLPRDQNAFALGARGAYGFDIIGEQNRWTGATANTVGFICGPEAISAVASQPLTPPNATYLSAGTVQLANGVKAAIYSWFSLNSRTLWSSYDIIFGTSVCDTTQGKILLSA